MRGLWLFMVLCDTEGVCPGDRWRFPFNDAAVRHHSSFAADHLRWAEGEEGGAFPAVRQVGMNAPFDWVCDARRRSNAWRLLKEAREATGDNERLTPLVQLRRLLGDDNYYRGVMPDPVPWRRFRIVE